MVRLLQSDGKLGDSIAPVYCEFSGKSTDSKPTEGIMTGSSFLEVDTTDVYFFDEDTSTWIKAGGSNE